MIRLDPNAFDIDPAASITALAGFIRAKMEELGQAGILVPFSGGLDSSTVLLLCVRAVGKERVKALLLPEKQGNPGAERYAKQLANQRHIETITRDISLILERLGAYQVFSHNLINPL